ncbi:MAG: GrpB family protein [Actinomycetota bacterium]|nr:GrpB family protein [Actinomycetota bacterium]
MEANEFAATAGSLRSDWLGLGVDYGTVRLTPARSEWAAIAERLAATIHAALGERAVSVEHVGSTAVPGLAAKPILDIAVGVGNEVPTEAVKECLEGLGYEFRSNAGDSGGLVFVLSDRPAHRVAHVHVVEHGGSQWHRYVAFRDLLLKHESARVIYERTKGELAERFPNDRKSYTAAKEEVVRNLLERYAPSGE